MTTTTITFDESVAPEDRDRAKPSIRALALCGRAWKAGRSSPFELRGRVFDRVPGSVEFSNLLHDALRDCLLGKAPGDLDGHLEELDRMEDWFAAVARLDDAYFGPCTVKHEDRPGNVLVDEKKNVWAIQRPARQPDTGWACDKSSPVEVGGVTYDRFTEDREWKQRGRTLTISARDRSFALYHVLRRALLNLQDVSDREAVMQASESLADHLFHNRGDWPESWGL